MNENIEHNKDVFRIYQDQIKDNDFRWYSAVIHFKCVKCSKYATSGNFKFCGNNPDKVLCYHCQGREGIFDDRGRFKKGHENLITEETRKGTQSER